MKKTAYIASTFTCISLLYIYSISLTRLTIQEIVTDFEDDLNLNMIIFLHDSPVKIFLVVIFRHFLKEFNK